MTTYNATPLFVVSCLFAFWFLVIVILDCFFKWRADGDREVTQPVASSPVSPAESPTASPPASPTAPSLSFTAFSDDVGPILRDGCDLHGEIVSSKNVAMEAMV